MVASIIFPALIPMGVSGYQPAGALYLDTSDSLTRTNSSASDNTKKVTVSLWVKMLSHTTAASIIRLNSPDFDRLNMEETGSDDAYFTLSVDGGSNDSWGNRQWRHPKKVRDVTGWQNLVFTFDSTASVADIFRIFDNGVEIEPVVFPPSGNFVSDSTISWMANSKSPIILSSGEWLVADYIVMDGIAVTNADNFGELSDGIWVPKDPSTISSFGTNGFWLDFSNGADIGNDASGNNNDFTPSSGVGANNIAVDGPANSDTKEITLHACLDPNHNGAYPCVISNNNLTYDWDGSGYTNSAAATLGVSSGKYYWEVRLNNNPPTTQNISTNIGIGLSTDSTVRNSDNSNYAGGTADSYAYRVGGTGIGGSQGKKFHNGTPESYNDGTSTAGDIIGVAYDATNRALWFSKNNSWIDGDGSDDSDDVKTEIQNGTTDSAAYNSSDIPAGTYHPIFTIGANDHDCTVRFSSSDWSYSPPSGFGEITNTVTGIGNYATLNPIASSNRKGGLSNGNLRASGVSKDNFSTMNIPLTGKWYFEGTLSAVAGTGKDAIGVAEALADQMGEYGNKVVVLYAKSGEKFLGTASSDNWLTYPSSGGTTYVAGDTIGVYVNAGQVTFYKNGSSQGTCGSAFTTQCFATTQNTNASTVWDVNFGQKPFKYSLPDADAKALTTQNLTEPTVTKPTDYFKAIIYEGTGSELKTGQGSGTVPEVGFAPDMVWIKDRDEADSHALFNSVIGVQNYFQMNNAGTMQSSSDGITAFTSSEEGSAAGFTIGGNLNPINSSGDSMVAWCWKAGGLPTADNSGGQTPTSGSRMVGGSVSTTNYSTQTTSGGTIKYPIRMSTASHGGLSIFTYNGGSGPSCIPHGLSTSLPGGGRPEMLIINTVSGDSGGGSASRPVFHIGTHATTPWLQWLEMSVNSSMSTLGAAGTWAWDEKQPGTETVTIGTGGAFNDAGDVYCAIAFARVPGLIGIGSYTGNASTDGPNIIIDDGASGFRPAWILEKRIDAAGAWYITDVARNTYNPVNLFLMADAANADGTGTTSSGAYLDVTANGYKIRGTSSGQEYNRSGTYIYLCFAEQPFGLNNRAR
jgi:hypothetical protein